MRTAENQIVERRTGMRLNRKRQLWVVLGCSLLMPTLARAENCAWLNAATAGGLLGGDPVMKVTHTSADDTTCRFTLKQGETEETLEIAVHTMAMVSHDFPSYLNQCTNASTPLRAIGNEAIECTLSAKPTETTETIVSRVRQRAFVLKWTMAKAGNATDPQSQDQMRDKIRNVAEQVAGSLF
jgi:hypothetical protein